MLHDFSIAGYVVFALAILAIAVFVRHRLLAMRLGERDRHRIGLRSGERVQIWKWIDERAEPTSERPSDDEALTSKLFSLSVLTFVFVRRGAERAAVIVAVLLRETNNG